MVSVMILNTWLVHTGALLEKARNTALSISQSLMVSKPKCFYMRKDNLGKYPHLILLK